MNDTLNIPSLLHSGTQMRSWRRRAVLSVIAALLAHCFFFAASDTIAKLGILEVLRPEPVAPKFIPPTPLQLMVPRRTFVSMDQNLPDEELRHNEKTAVRGRANRAARDTEIDRQKPVAAAPAGTGEPLPAEAYQSGRPSPAEQTQLTQAGTPPTPPAPQEAPQPEPPATATPPQTTPQPEPATRPAENTAKPAEARETEKTAEPQPTEPAPRPEKTPQPVMPSPAEKTPPRSEPRPAEKPVERKTPATPELPDGPELAMATLPSPYTAARPQTPPVVKPAPKTEPAIQPAPEVKPVPETAPAPRTPTLDTPPPRRPAVTRPRRAVPTRRLPPSRRIGGPSAVANGGRLQTSNSGRAAMLASAKSLAVLRDRYGEYMDILLRRIQNAIYIQQQVSPMMFDQGAVVMTFTVSPQGRLQAIRFVAARPDYLVHEKAAARQVLEDVQNGEPLPPPTEEMLADPLFQKITINFLFAPQ